jgi:hypothetical protein
LLLGWTASRAHPCALLWLPAWLTALPLTRTSIRFIAFISWPTNIW